MTGTDRAFRALAQHDPAALGSLLHVLMPEQIPESPQLRGEDLQPTRLEALAPATEADWIGQVGNSVLAPVFHVEAQGYGDTTLTDRVFFYHLVTVVRNRERPVHSMVLWLKRPTSAQGVELIQRVDLTLRIRSFVLPDMDASVLLANDETACFAAACDPGPMSFEELCGRVCDALVRTGASWYRRHMAAVCALSQGRLRVMVDAMAQRNLEPVIIEDLVKYGEEIGFEKGEQTGLDKGELKEARKALRRVLSRKQLFLSSEQEQLIDGCDKLDQLETWLDDAVLASSCDDVFRRAAPSVPS